MPRTMDSTHADKVTIQEASTGDMPVNLAPHTWTGSDRTEYVPGSDLIALLDDHDEDDNEPAFSDQKYGRGRRLQQVVRAQVQRRLRTDELRNNIRELTRKIRIFFM